MAATISSADSIGHNLALIQRLPGIFFEQALLNFTIKFAFVFFENHTLLHVVAQKNRPCERFLLIKKMCYGA